MFMANLIRGLGLDVDYGTKVFGAKTTELVELEKQLRVLLPSLETVNQPAVSIFVKSDREIKNDSWNFFQRLCNQVRASEGRGVGWVEVFGFNDGAMPEYPDPRIRSTFPFYGLQEVHEVTISPTTTSEEILETCRQKSRASMYVIIDKHRNLPEDFVKTLIRYCHENKDQILGFRIYNRER
jgi:hypothetical protein